MTDANANSQIDKALDQLGKTLEQGNVDTVVNLFHADSYWRDLVSFTWNIKTLEGPEQIRDMLKQQLASIKPSGWPWKTMSSFAPTATACAFRPPAGCRCCAPRRAAATFAWFIPAPTRWNWRARWRAQAPPCSSAARAAPARN